MAERLRNATSPYLRQHADNPVDWWEWGPDAFAEAERRGVPVFLSIGYSTCHWCHVMAHESFEDPETAEHLNAGFVAIKVDREERPDVDALYMAAAQAMGQGGGWPLSVFLTPDRRPFHAGTYFPPQARHGMPSFRQVLDAVSRAWAENREAVVEAGEAVRAHLAELWGDGAPAAPPPAVSAADAAVPDAPAEPEGEGGHHRHAPAAPSNAADPAVSLAEAGTAPESAPDWHDPTLTDTAIEDALAAVAAQHDPANGGFGGAPKFPMAPALTFLIRHAAMGGRADALNIVARTLNAMDKGGIHDHIAGGFARYAVDVHWDVPHFEKMLTDNAQLLLLYAEMYAMTGRPGWARPARGIVEWLEREMRTDEGAFAAGLDADAAGIEGSFTVWTSAQVKAAFAAAELPERDADLLIAHYGIGAAGGRGAHEGGYVPRVAVPAEDLAVRFGTDVDDVGRRLSGGRAVLLAAREKRVRPHRDDKIVAAGNGLAIGGLARSGTLLGEPGWVDVAREVADAVVRLLVDDDGTVWRSYSAGRRSGPGMLEDYGALAIGMFALAVHARESRWRETAGRIVERGLELFGDDGVVLLRDSADSDLLVPPRDVTDSATPSGNSMWADAAATWAALTQDAGLADRARRVAGAAAEAHQGHPLFAGYAFATAERLARPARELTLVGEPAARMELRKGALRRVDPRLVVAEVDWEDAVALPMVADRPLPEGARAAAYLCEDYVCRPPVTTAEELAELLGARPVE